VKLILVLLICYLTMSPFYSASKLSHRHQHRHTKRGVGSCLINIAKGLAMTLANNPPGLDKCFPASWKMSANSVPSANTDDLYDKMGHVGPILKGIIGAVGVVIGIACKFKGAIVKCLKKMFRRRYMRRQFFRMTRKGWFINACKSVVNKIKDTIVNGIKWVGDKVASAAFSVFGKIAAVIKTAGEKIANFINSPTFKAIINFINCLKTLAHAAKAVITYILNFAKCVTQIIAGLGNWGNLLLILFNMICQWDNFKKAADYLISAVSKSGDTRCDYLGRFVGTLVIIVANSKI
jgi:hypothetical protein